MKTLSCSVARNNDLLTKEETKGQLIHTNEAYAHTLYTRIRVYAYAYSRIYIRVYAYWADAYYAYILVRIYLSCSVATGTGRDVQHIGRVDIEVIYLFCINLQFAELGGFEEIKKQIETAEKVDAPV